MQGPEGLLVHCGLRMQGQASGTQHAPALQAPVLLGSLEVVRRHSMSEMAVKCGIPRVPGRNPEGAQSEMIWNVGFVGRPAWGPAVVVPQNL